MSDYQGTSKSKVTVHINSKHNNVRYSCDICEATFAQKGHIRLHKMAKHGEEKISCDQCE